MDPLTLVYLALMLASTGANYAGQRKVGHERAKVMAEDRRRREETQRQNDAAARSTQENFAKSRADEEQRGKELAERYKQPEKTPIPTGGGEVRLLDTLAPTSSTATINDFQREMAKSKGLADQLATLEGRMGGYGSVLNENMIGAARNETDINQGLTSMRSWAQNVLPTQLNAANQAGNQWKGAADIMKLAATVMSPWAFSKTVPDPAGMGTGTGPQAEILNAAKGPQPVYGGFNTSGLTGPAGMAERIGANVGDRVPGVMRGMDAITNPLGIVANPARDAALNKMLRGIPLTQEEQLLVYMMN